MIVELTSGIPHEIRGRTGVPTLAGYRSRWDVGVAAAAWCRRLPVGRFSFSDELRPMPSSLSVHQ